MTDHPITPPPELVEQWLTEGRHQDYCSATEHAIVQAAKWGADQELEACCAWLIANDNPRWAVALQEGRRPKPPSLAEQALLAIDTAVADGRISAEVARVTRAALERLQELENNG